MNVGRPKPRALVLPVTIQTVEACLERRRPSLRFPPALEQQFEKDTEDRRRSRLKLGILVSAILYNCFLIADWLLIPDVFRVALALHLCVVTPWMLFAAWIMTKRPDAFVRECVAASVPLLIILQIDCGIALTSSDNAAHYQYVVIPTLLYVNVSLHRLQFTFARALSILIVACHTLVLLVASEIERPVVGMIIVQITVCAYISLVANFTMERDLRRAYLFSLRDRLLHVEAEATARRDALTGLGNRHHLGHELPRLWTGGAENSTFVSVILTDIDRFKQLNDRYGHAVGDQCLKRLASIIIRELEGSVHSVVRYGGEEFLILLPEMQLVDAIRVAERIRSSIEQARIPNEGIGPVRTVTASFGVASAFVSDMGAEELIAAADLALYAAKRSGRNCVWPPSNAHPFEPRELRDRA